MLLTTLRTGLGDMRKRTSSPKWVKPAHTAAKKQRLDTLLRSPAISYFGPALGRLGRLMRISVSGECAQHRVVERIPGRDVKRVPNESHRHTDDTWKRVFELSDQLITPVVKRLL